MINVHCSMTSYRSEVLITPSLTVELLTRFTKAGKPTAKLPKTSASQRLRGEINVSVATAPGTDRVSLRLTMNPYGLRIDGIKQHAILGYRGVWSIDHNA